MLLAMDVGNSNIKMGIFSGDDLVQSFRVRTDHKRSSDEYGVMMHSFLSCIGMEFSDFHGVMISSVVPGLNFTLMRMVQTYFHKTPAFVSSQLNCGIDISYSPVSALGADRIANATAAYAAYGGPVITVDFGTATTFGVVNEKGCFVGGAIAPGIQTSADALINRTSALKRFTFETPKSAIADNTADALQSGALYGFTGLTDGILKRLLAEMPGSTVVATGGLCEVIASLSEYVHQVDKLLTLQGVKRIYQLNF